MPKAKKSKKPLSNPDDIIHNLLNDIASEPSLKQASEPIVPAIVENNEDEDTVDISVSSIIINNEEYLIDDEFNLYDIKTNENIGTFINEQLQLNA
jgi:hypothetical protein